MGLPLWKVACARHLGLQVGVLKKWPTALAGASQRRNRRKKRLVRSSWHGSRDVPPLEGLKVLEKAHGLVAAGYTCRF